MSSDNLSSLTDAELTSLHLADHTEAFESLVDRYARPLYGYARRLTGNDADAEDIAQETFVRLHENLPKLSLDKPLKPWLYKVCTNLCRNLAKRKKGMLFSQLASTGEESEESIVERLESKEPTPPEIHHTSERKEYVQSAISALPKEYQVVTTLYYWEELSYKEIADTLSIPINTVRTHLRRAKKLLLPSLKHLL